MNRLTERDWKSKCEGYPWNVHPVKDINDLQYYKKLAEYEDEYEQGLLFRLPCKEGDIVYAIDGSKMQVLKARRDVALISGELCIYVENSQYADYISYKDLGKTVFLKKEDAELRLKYLVD